MRRQVSNAPYCESSVAKRVRGGIVLAIRRRLRNMSRVSSELRRASAGLVILLKLSAPRRRLSPGRITDCRRPMDRDRVAGHGVAPPSFGLRPAFDLTVWVTAHSEIERYAVATGRLTDSITTLPNAGGLAVSASD
jgi:hypothetical protein